MQAVSDSILGPRTLVFIENQTLLASAETRGLLPSSPVVTTDIALYSHLIAKGYSCYFVESLEEEPEIHLRAKEVWRFCERYYEALNQRNADLISELFQESDIDFFGHFLSYLFRSLAVNCHRFLGGLNRIQNKIEAQSVVCFALSESKKQYWYNNKKGFFFPGDLALNLLVSWASSRQLRLVQGDQSIEGVERTGSCNESAVQTGRPFMRRVKDKAKTFLQRARPAIPGLPNLLMLGSPYNLREIEKSFSIALKCNLFYLSSADAADRSGSFAWQLDVEVPSDPFACFGMKFSQFVEPLVKNLLDSQVDEILSAWSQVKRFHRSHGLSAVAWGLPPVESSLAFANYFAQRQGIPRVGSQHGGGYGVHADDDKYWELDYKASDVYLTYGFSDRYISKLPRKVYPTFVPTGAVIIDPHRIGKKNIDRRKRTKILFPLSSSSTSFFTMAYPCISHVTTFEFQKQVVELLERFFPLECVVQFVPDQFERHPIRSVLEKSNSCLRVERELNFLQVLENYSADLILLDKTYTLLNEVVLTGSQLLVLDQGPVNKLTPIASELLNRRAVVCDSSEKFIATLRRFLESGDFDWKDVEDNAFASKFSTFEGEPTKNVEKAVLEVVRQGRNKKDLGSNEDC